MPWSRTICPATMMVSPSMILAGPVSEPMRRLNVKMATRRPRPLNGLKRTPPEASAMVGP
jgi:hypothetical protein